MRRNCHALLYQKNAVCSTIRNKKRSLRSKIDTISTRFLLGAS